MATAVHIPVSDYLQTSYRPDCDYVDGELQERNLGEEWHSAVQLAIGTIFQNNRKTWQLRPYTEQRVRVTPSRFRVPDVCAVPTDKPFRGVLTEPPVLCIEVLSPEDRLHRVVTRAQEYLGMGVANIWIVDPKTRECWTMTATGAVLPMLDDAFTIAGTPVRVALADIFEEIDAAPKA